MLSFDLEHFETGGFSEDTHTLLISRGGASVTLRNPVSAGDSLRIINLTNHSEADFRVVGELAITKDGAVIWAVECLDRRDDFWGVECLPSIAEISKDINFLQCRVCGMDTNRSLTVMELEVLRSGGMIILNCDSCCKSTYWVDADPNRPLSNFSAAEAATPQPSKHESEEAAEKKNNVEKRAAKRSRLKLSILVRNQAGEQEVSRIVDISKSGTCVSLYMRLLVGDIVKIICPYDPRSGGIEQTAEVRWRSRYYNEDFPRTYGLRFLR